jgi:hypothetical protein
VSCPDQAGAKTGLPDVPVVTLWEVQQNSPVSFPITAPSKLFSDPSGESYQARVGRFRWYLENVSKDLHGVFLVGADLEALKTASMPIWLGAQKVGIESDGVYDIHGADGQDKYLPIAAALKADGSTIVSSAVNDTSQAYMLKEAAVQGVNTVKVWDCSLQCYDKDLVSSANAADTEGQYVWIPFIPFEEASTSPAEQNFLKYIGRDKADGFSLQAYASGLFLRDVINSVTKDAGNDAVTRAAVLKAAPTITSFNADGMLGEANVGEHIPSPCYALLQIKGGKFVRVFPTKKGTLNCDPKNLYTIKMDLS